MSERAYSFELQKNISAKEAVRLSDCGQLTDERAFRCSDEKCRIPLTCTNWENKNGKRFYFVPSHNGELHVIGCDEVGKKDERQQIMKEIRDIIEGIKSNGIITMMVSPDKNTKEAENIQDSKRTLTKDIGYIYKRESDYQGIKQEGRRAARIESFVELFNRENIDKDKKIICVKGKMLSLNELFVMSDKKLKDRTFGIFYGKTLIKTCTFNTDMIEITFLNSSFPKIYTNIDSLQKIGNGRKVRRYIDSDECIMTYFRGVYYQEENKFKPYNDKFYKDLYFQII